MTYIRDWLIAEEDFADWLKAKQQERDLQIAMLMLENAAAKHKPQGMRAWLTRLQLWFHSKVLADSPAPKQDQ